MLILKDNRIGFWFWFGISIICALVFYQSLDQPILFDRSVLMYQSQLVSNGMSLYHDSTCGYTPLLIILVGGLMKLGALFSINSITLASIAGHLLHGAIAGSFFLLAKSIFSSERIVLISCILMTGMSYLCVVAGINAEPKIVIILLSILSTLYFIKEKWVLCGLMISLAGMCWQPMLVSWLAFFIWVVIHSWPSTKNVFRFIFGCILGTLPVIIYLSITNSWLPFYTQAIVRVYSDSSTIAFKPLSVLYMPLYSRILTESWICYLGITGFGIGLFNYFKNKEFSIYGIENQKFIKLMFTIIGLWIVLYSIEIRDPHDLFTTLPFLVLIAASLLAHWMSKIQNINWQGVLFFMITILSLGDMVTYTLPYSRVEQQSTIDKINRDSPNILAVRSSFLYVLNEKIIPTKFISLKGYEIPAIEEYGGCDQLLQDVRKKNIDYIAIPISRRIDQKSYRKYLKMIRRIRPPQRDVTLCEEIWLPNMKNKTAIDSFQIKHQLYMFGNWHITTSYYVYELD